MKYVIFCAYRNTHHQRVCHFYFLNIHNKNLANMISVWEVVAVSHIERTAFGILNVYFGNPLRPEGLAFVNK
jgi:hypothetical protein